MSILLQKKIINFVLNIVHNYQKVKVIVENNLLYA